jgi:hypothetical protein
VCRPPRSYGTRSVPATLVAAPPPYGFPKAPRSANGEAPIFLPRKVATPGVRMDRAAIGCSARPRRGGGFGNSAFINPYAGCGIPNRVLRRGPVRNWKSCEFVRNEQTSWPAGQKVWPTIRQLAELKGLAAHERCPPQTAGPRSHTDGGRAKSRPPNDFGVQRAASKTAVVRYGPAGCVQKVPGAAAWDGRSRVDDTYVVGADDLESRNSALRSVLLIRTLRLLSSLNLLAASCLNGNSSQSAKRTSRS